MNSLQAKNKSAKTGILVSLNSIELKVDRKKKTKARPKAGPSPLRAQSKEGSPDSTPFLRRLCTKNNPWGSHPRKLRQQPTTNNQQPGNPNERAQTIPMPPHLHRRPPLRQPMPARRRPLLLPPHHPQTSRRRKDPQDPPLHLRPPAPRRPIRHPALHRPGPPANRRQRNRPQKSRPPPLRPSDRQPQPPQTNHHAKHTIQTANHTPNRRRDHPPPRTRHSRPTIRDH